MSETEPRLFVSPDDVETLALQWGAMKWLSTPAVTGAEGFSVGVEIIKAGEERPRQHHPEVELLLYVISGEGEQTVGSETGALRPGTVVFIPAGAYHATTNTGWEPLKLLVVASPPGLETELGE